MDNDSQSTGGVTVINKRNLNANYARCDFGVDNALSGVTTNSSMNDLTDRVLGVSPQRPSGVSQLKEYFNTAAFTKNALGTVGDSGRNSTFAPGQWNADAGVLKTFPLVGKLNLTLRGEAFNLFNHVNFGAPVATFTGTQFGQITSAAGPRVLQVSMRLTF